MVCIYSWGRKDLSCFIGWRKEAITQSGLRKWNTVGFHGDVRSLREEEERDEGLGEKGGVVVHWWSKCPCEGSCSQHLSTLGGGHKSLSSNLFGPQGFIVQPNHYCEQHRTTDTTPHDPFPSPMPLTLTFPTGGGSYYQLPSLPRTAGRGWATSGQGCGGLRVRFPGRHRGCPAVTGGRCGGHSCHPGPERAAAAREGPCHRGWACWPLRPGH